MPSSDHVVGWYVIILWLVVIAALVGMLLSCGDPTGPERGIYCAR